MQVCSCTCTCSTCASAQFLINSGTNRYCCFSVSTWKQEVEHLVYQRETELRTDCNQSRILKEMLYNILHYLLAVGNELGYC